MPTFNLKTLKPRHLCQVLLILVGVSMLFSGCSTFKGMFDKITFGSDGKPQEEAPEILIINGMEAYNTGQYEKALTAFNMILDRHPFSDQAVLAELKAADAHYYKGDYLEAKLLYQEFEERHPTNEAMAYVLFQYAMCDFARSDRIDRDVSGAREAIKSFTRLLRSYPDSPYSTEARARILTARDFLVNHEYFVAVFYVKQEKYDQAKHRLRYLLANYPASSIAPKAEALLARLEAENPPSWGIDQWLPDVTLPQWMKWGGASDIDD
ncbi:MAG: outer membrane protein assembly factor BamD [Desulfobulbus propionicus]|nr:MAG: outer membrane protein assembly factor BamD [Desulfobulbus propionicus]